MNRSINLLISIIFIINSLHSGVIPPALAQATASTIPFAASSLPEPGTMTALSRMLMPPLLKGINVNVQDPFRFDFVLDPGAMDFKSDALKRESEKLIRYFMAALAVPEGDLWVNLSPYENDRIIPEAFGITEMGRDLLAQDYLLKQITASLLYPEHGTGKNFWQKVYARAQQEFGTTDIPTDTFNKVWIVPDKAVVYEDGTRAVVVKASLKVMLESDYVALSNNPLPTGGHVAPQGYVSPSGLSSDITKDIMREVILSVLEKEVNEGANFAPLRQVYYSLILAKWYKENLKQSILIKGYADHRKVAGLKIDDTGSALKIYARYMEALRRGAFNYIKEEYDPATQDTIPRRYFSGGVGLQFDLKRTDNAALVTDDGSPVFKVEGDFLGAGQMQGAPKDADPAQDPEDNFAYIHLMNSGIRALRKGKFKTAREIIAQARTAGPEDFDDRLSEYLLPLIRKWDEPSMRIAAGLIKVAGYDAKKFDAFCRQVMSYLADYHELSGSSDFDRFPNPSTFALFLYEIRESDGDVYLRLPSALRQIAAKYYALLDVITPSYSPSPEEEQKIRQQLGEYMGRIDETALMIEAYLEDNPHGSSDMLGYLLDEDLFALEALKSLIAVIVRTPQDLDGPQLNKLGLLTDLIIMTSHKNVLAALYELRRIAKKTGRNIEKVLQERSKVQEEYRVRGQPAWDVPQWQARVHALKRVLINRRGDVDPGQAVPAYDNGQIAWDGISDDPFEIKGVGPCRVEKMDALSQGQAALDMWYAGQSEKGLQIMRLAWENQINYNPGLAATFLLLRRASDNKILGLSLVQKFPSEHPETDEAPFVYKPFLSDMVRKHFGMPGIDGQILPEHTMWRVAIAYAYRATEHDLRLLGRPAGDLDRIWRAATETQKTIGDRDRTRRLNEVRRARKAKELAPRLSQPFALTFGSGMYKMDLPSTPEAREQVIQQWFEQRQDGKFQRGALAIRRGSAYQWAVLRGPSAELLGFVIFEKVRRVLNASGEVLNAGGKNDNLVYHIVALESDPAHTLGPDKGWWVGRYGNSLDLLLLAYVMEQSGLTVQGGFAQGVVTLTPPMGSQAEQERWMHWGLKRSRSLPDEFFASEEISAKVWGAVKLWIRDDAQMSVGPVELLAQQHKPMIDDAVGGIDLNDPLLGLETTGPGIRPLDLPAGADVDGVRVPEGLFPAVMRVTPLKGIRDFLNNR